MFDHQYIGYAVCRWSSTLATRLTPRIHHSGYFIGLALSWLDYVEENKEEKGTYAPLQGQPRQASKHGAWLVTTAICMSLPWHDNRQ